MIIHIAGFFWFLICSSDALQCKHCLERDSDICTSENSINCGDSAGCAAASGFFQNGLEKTRFIYKGCRFPIACDSWLCISMNGTYLQSYITCCEGENCQLDYYIPSDVDEPTNGKKCVSCYEEGGTEECESVQTQDCRGDETRCLDYRGSLLKPDGIQTEVSFKGCANPLACEYFQFFYYFQEVNRLDFNC